MKPPFVKVRYIYNDNLNPYNFMTLTYFAKKLENMDIERQTSYCVLFEKRSNNSNKWVEINNGSNCHYISPNFHYITPFNNNNSDKSKVKITITAYESFEDFLSDHFLEFL